MLTASSFKPRTFVERNAAEQSDFRDPFNAIRWVEFFIVGNGDVVFRFEIPSAPLAHLLASLEFERRVFTVEFQHFLDPLRHDFRESNHQNALAGDVRHLPRPFGLFQRLSKAAILPVRESLYVKRHRYDCPLVIQKEFWHRQSFLLANLDFDSDQVRKSRWELEAVRNAIRAGEHLKFRNRLGAEESPVVVNSKSAEG